MLGKDVEDELCSIDDAELQLILESALLARCELVVDSDGLGSSSSSSSLELDELPFADVGARIRCWSTLNQHFRWLNARGAKERGEFVELHFCVHIGCHDRHNEAALGPGARCGIRLMLGHPRDYAPESTQRDDAILEAASSSRSSGMVRERRTNPSPLGPKDGPGERTTCASSSTNSAKDVAV